MLKTLTTYLSFVFARYTVHVIVILIVGSCVLISDHLLLRKKKKKDNNRIEAEGSVR